MPYKDKDQQLAYYKKYNDERTGTEEYKEQRRKYMREYRQRPEVKQRERARLAVKGAIKYGALVRPDHCDICGCECKPDAHHWHGYDEDHKLDVQWVCKSCHKELTNDERKVCPDNRVTQSD